MAIVLKIHPVSPQERLIKQAIAVLKRGDVIVYPTDTFYGLACTLGNKAGMEKIQQIRQAKINEIQFSLVCRDLSSLALYAKVNNSQFRLLKACLPGAYTFILEASKEVPKRLMQKRNAVGLRVPDHPVVQLLLQHLEAPLLSATLKLPQCEDYELNDGESISQYLDQQVGVILDAGACAMIPSTVVNLLEETPVIVRHGAGSTHWFE